MFGLKIKLPKSYQPWTIWGLGMCRCWARGSYQYQVNGTRKEEDKKEASPRQGQGGQ